jgi:hypothetical protein
MNKSILKSFKQLDKQEERLKKNMNILSKKIQKYFDFEVGVTFCESDGFLILNVNTSDVYTLDIINKFKKGIKLNREDCDSYSI